MTQPPDSQDASSPLAEATRCDLCDRADCPYIPFERMDYIEYDAQDGDVADVARKDCEAHWVNWRTRALEAEADVLAMLDLVEKLAVIASDHLAALRRRAIADRAARRLRPVGPPTD